MDDSEFLKFKRDMSTNSRALQQAFALSTSEMTSLQLLDTPLVSAFIIPDQPVEAYGADLSNVIDPDEDIKNIGNAIMTLYAERYKSCPFRVLISDPTVMELKYGLNVIESRYEKDAQKIISDDALYDDIMYYLDQDEFEFIDVPRELQREVQEFINNVPLTQQSGNPIAFQNLCSQGAISGLGQWFSRDDYQKKRDTIIKLCKNIVDFLSRHRKRRSGETEVGFRRRNRFDAANFAMAYHLNKVRSDLSVNLAAPFPAYLDHEKAHHSVFRSRMLPQALVFSLRSLNCFIKDEEWNVKSKAGREASDQLRIAMDRAKDMYTYIKGLDTVVDLSDRIKEEMILFYYEVLSELRVGVVQKFTREQARRRAREILTSKDAFRDRYTIAAKAVGDAARDLSIVTPIADSEELIVDFDWDDDQVLMRSVKPSLT